MGDIFGNRITTSFGVGVSLKYTFGGRFSLAVGAGMSQRYGGAMLSHNIGLNIYNSGVGTRSGVRGRPDITFRDLNISHAFTCGWGGYKNPAVLNTFHNNAISGVMNPYKDSFTLGTNFVYNSIGRNQLVGYLGVKFDQFDLNFYNDVILLIGDKEDRWWTGGGSVNYRHFSIATDVFTGIRNPKIRDKEGNLVYPKDTDNPAKGNHGTYQQTADQREYNNGQTLFLVRDRYRAAGLVMEGSSHMRFQNLIHDRDGWLQWMGNVPRFYSEAERRYGITGRSMWGF